MLGWAAIRLARHTLPPFEASLARARHFLLLAASSVFPFQLRRERIDVNNFHVGVKKCLNSDTLRCPANVVNGVDCEAERMKCVL